MPPSPKNPSRGSPSPESSGRRRHLYLIELVLGGGFVLLVVLIFMSGNPRGDRNDRGGASTKHDAPNPNIVTVTSGTWQREVLDSRTPVVVDFWAPWCVPCRMLSPAIDHVAGKFAGKVKVAKLNIDDARDIAREYNINAIPQVLLFHDGVPQRIAIDPGDLPASEASIAAAIGQLGR